MQFRKIMSTIALTLGLLVSSRPSHAACTNNYAAQAFVYSGLAGPSYPAGSVRVQIDPWDADNFYTADGLRVWINGRIWEYYDNMPQSWYYDKVIRKGAGRYSFYAKEKTSCGPNGGWTLVYSIVVP